MSYKFKLWDKRENRWETIRSIGLDENGSVFYIQCWDEAERDIDPPYFMDNLSVGFELMQFTGLTDVNGREIYEGDIVLADSEYGEKVRDIVCWSYGSFYVANHTFKKLNNIEVIGNIYQHKHLLKENEK